MKNDPVQYVISTKDENLRTSGLEKKLGQRKKGENEQRALCTYDVRVGFPTRNNTAASACLALFSSADHSL